MASKGSSSSNSSIIPSTTTALRKRCWNAAVPVSVRLAQPLHFQACLSRAKAPSKAFEEDKSGFDDLKPFVMLARRTTYLSMHLREIEEYFAILVPKLASEATGDEAHWHVKFGHGDRALPWHYPIGLLYDLLIDRRIGGGTLDLAITFTTEADQFTFAPSNADYEMRSVYHSLLKQSDHLRWRSCRRLNTLPRGEQAQLWEALAANLPGRFWRVNNGLVDTGSSGMDCKWADYCMMVAGGRSEDAQAIQFDEPEAFGAIAVKLYHGSKVRMLAVPAFTDDRLTLLDGIVGSGAVVITQGICIPPSTPLLWLMYHLAYADNMLHLVVASEDEGKV